MVIINRKQLSVLQTSHWYYLLIVVLIVSIVVSAIYSVSVGQVSIPFEESFKIVIYKLSAGRWVTIDELANQSFVNIIWQLRFPRVIFALLIGMGLSVSGTVMQSVVQNPIADPYILGISSGASLGATFAILVGFGTEALFAP